MTYRFFSFGWERPDNRKTENNPEMYNYERNEHIGETGTVLKMDENSV